MDRQAERLLEESGMIEEQVRESRTSLEQMKAQAHLEARAFEDKMDELERLISSERNAGGDGVQGHIGELSTEEEKSLRRRNLRAGEDNAAVRDQIREAERQEQRFRKAFERLKQQTGISDTAQLVEQFLLLVDQNYVLFNYVNRTEDECVASSHGGLWRGADASDSPSMRTGTTRCRKRRRHCTTR